MDLLIATGNPGKFREYQVMLKDLPFRLLSLRDVGLEDMVVEENGETFTENARIKATAYARASGKHVLADDSGLCVNALDGAPGVRSARYGGDGLDDAGRRHKLLQAMAAVPDEQRRAYFQCVIALADPQTLDCQFAEGACNGMIRHVDADGPEGFGYDAIFQPEGHDVTFAQMSKETKNRLSHRGRAVEHMVPILRELI
jgi:XTP/dITP diphosphohydrolase